MQFWCDIPKYLINLSSKKVRKLGSHAIFRAYMYLSAGIPKWRFFFFFYIGCVKLKARTKICPFRMPVFLRTDFGYRRVFLLWYFLWPKFPNKSVRNVSDELLIYILQTGKQEGDIACSCEVLMTLFIWLHFILFYFLFFFWGGGVGGWLGFSK